ncbi:hypothetical protein NDU88_005287 [Pleurodeles waltl]|uniref:Uncharacterized protein n=1 Tax=Pleurodeles waltl TaxID=8319 RepID=A0AAV7VJF2_PLEWA|nr:hypothetical protein NDU88_005287 [Pleurodeles waltl]
MFPPDYIYLRSKVPKLRPIDSTRIPSAVKSRKCDVSRAIYTDVKEGTSLDTRYHGGGLMELEFHRVWEDLLSSWKSGFWRQADLQHRLKKSNGPS